MKKQSGNFILILLSLLIMASCNWAKFDKAPGTRIEGMPNRLIGTYEVKFKGSIGQIDTFKVSLDMNSILIFSKEEVREFIYGRDYLLYSLEDLTIVAFPDADFKKLRNLIVLEPEKKGVKMYPILEKQSVFGTKPDFEGVFPLRTMMVNQDPIEIKQETGGVSFEMEALSQENNFAIGFYQMEDPQFSNLFRTRFKDKNFIYMNKFIPPSISPKKEKSRK